MELYIGNIHDDTSAGELRRFFMAYTKKATRVQFKVIRILDEDTGLKAYVGMGRIEPDKLADKAIKKLHRTKMRGKPVIVREYQHRSANNDKRGVGWRSRDWDTDNRRYTDRRRRHLRLNTVVELEFEGMGGFARK